MLSILNATEQNATPNRSPLMPVNVQITTQDVTNDDTAKQNGNSSNELSIREKLRQISLENKINPIASDTNDTPLSLEIRAKVPLQLTDLIPDCLEYIFSDLYFSDLISVAGTCKSLQNNVSDFFKSHVKVHEIILDCNEYPRYQVRMRSNRWPHEFNGSNFAPFILRLNEVIERMTIINLFPLGADEMRLQNDTEIERMIVNALAQKEQLHELKFTRCGRRTMMEHTSMEFHVKKLSFERCTFGSSAFHWPNLFPNLQQLSIIDCDVSMARECIEKSFQHLTGFELIASYSNENSWFDCTFTIPNVQRAINENPNIRKLALCYWNATAYDAKLLKYAAEHLPLLQSLHLWHLKYTEFFSEGDINLMFVRKFILSNDFFHSEKLKRNLASLTFYALQKFYFLGHYDAECVTFLARHQTIQKFVCRPNGQHFHYPTDFDITTFGNILPQLKTLCISGKCLTSDGLIRFISDCKTVTLIKVLNHAFSPPMCQQFGKDCMEHGWKVSHVHVDNVPKIIMRKI